MIDLQPFLEEGFLRYALLGLLMLAPMCAAMGVQVVNLRMAFFSDAVSHSAFAGVAIGLLAAIDVQVSMGVLALLIGLMITAVARRGKLSVDTVIGVFFSAVVAFGLAVVYRHRHIAGQVQMLIYGNILTIGPRELVCQAVLLAGLAAFQVLGFNRLLYIALNPALAAAHRVHTRVYQYLYAALLSVVVVFSVQAVGVFLVTAMLIVPAAAARNLARAGHQRPALGRYSAGGHHCPGGLGVVPAQRVDRGPSPPLTLPRPRRSQIVRFLWSMGSGRTKERTWLPACRNGACQRASRRHTA